MKSIVLAVSVAVCSLPAPAIADMFDGSPYESNGALSRLAGSSAQAPNYSPRASFRNYSPAPRQAGRIAFTPVAPTFNWSRPVDHGGQISEYVGRIVAAAGQRHEIRGDCMSACTMWLGHRNACVAADALLHFHGATERQALSVPATWRSVNATGNAALLAFYPSRVRQVVRPWLASAQFRTLTGAQLIGLGVPACA